MTARNHHALTIAHNLENDATLIQAAYDWINQQRSIIEHWTTGVTYDDTSRSTTTTTQPEKETLRIDNLNSEHWLLNQLLKVLDDNRKDLRHECYRILRTRDTETDQAPRCDARHLEGYDLAQTDGGWSDPTCTRIPRAGQTGPCDACYMRHIRYRKRAGLKPLNDTQPARP